MKRILLSLLIIGLFFGCEKKPLKTSHLSNLYKQFQKEVREEYGLFLIERDSGEKSFNKLSLDFYYYGEAPLHVARLLVHQVTEDLLKKINRTPILQNELDHFPVHQRDIDIAISFIDRKTLKTQRHNEIAHALFFDGVVHFFRYDKFLDELVPMHQEMYVSSLTR